MQIKCLGCGRIVNVDRFNRNGTCSNCGNYFEELINQNYGISNKLEQNVKNFPQVPRIMLGNKGIYTQKSDGYVQNAYKPTNNPNLISQKVPIQEKIVDCAFYLMIFLVLGYVAYRIIKTFVFGG